jgi:hypothetical protein
MSDDDISPWLDNDIDDLLTSPLPLVKIDPRRIFVKRPVPRSWTNRSVDL